MEVPQKQQLSVDEIKKQSFLKNLSDNLLLIPNLPTPTTEQNNKNRDKKTMQIGSTLQNIAKQKKKTEEELENNDEQQNVEKSEYQGIKFDKRIGKTKRLLNVFSVNRGQCTKCQPGQCISYRCSFNIESFRGVEIFQCLNCGCPMNSHYIIKQQGQFSNLLCKYICRRYIKPGHFDFNGLTAIFFVDKVQAQNFELDIETLVNILNEASYNVSSFYELELVELQKIWMQKKLYSQKKTIPKEQFNGYVNFFETFLILFDNCNDEGLFNLRKRLNDPDHIDKLEFFMNLIEDVNKKLIWAQEQQKKAFVFLLTGRRADPYNDFKKLLKGANEYLPEELHYFYSSKSRYNALRDALFFFPSFFKLRISSFIMTEQSKDSQKLERMNDSFKDLLDFNNFSILSEKYTKQQLSSLYQAFEFLPNPERFLQSFQNQNDRQIQLKMVSKIGPQGLTILQQNMPNFYRISSEKENLTIQEKLCPNLSHNQRFIVMQIDNF